MHDTEVMIIKVLKHLLNLLSIDYVQESQEKSEKIKTMKFNNRKKIDFLENLVRSKDKRIKSI